MNKYHLYAFWGCILVAVAGMWMPVMDIDAAQYASISREMLRSGNYLHVYDAGKEYLDKPPLLFWISSWSMKLLGVNHFVYRLPSVLFATLAVYATYQLTALYYSRERARLAAVVLATSQGFLLMCHDVRTDTMLMGWVIFSTWQLAKWSNSGQIRLLLLASAGIAFGMMTKGPIALLVPGFAIFPQLILKRKIGMIFHWSSLAGLLLMAVLLLPMSWGLYTQFDLHPEKLVNGTTGVSGLRFFYWTQSFGRITGESTWDNQAGIFFLFQNMLWSFLPWIIFFVCAFINEVLHVIKSRLNLSDKKEIIALCGFLLSYLALGMSHYQLPHYIFVAFPFAAIITSGWLENLLEGKQQKWERPIRIFHLFVFSLLWIGLILLLRLPFPEISFFWMIASMLSFAGLMVLYLKTTHHPYRLVFLAIYTSIGMNFFLNSAFYPRLLKYQAGSEIGKWMHQHQIPAESTGIYQYVIWRSIHFYADGIVQQKDEKSMYQPGDYLITSNEKLNELKASGIHCKKLFETFDFPVTRLSIPFLQPDKRKALLQQVVLIQIEP